MTIDEIRKRYETLGRIISVANALGAHDPSIDTLAAVNIDIAALLAAHDLQSARADAAEAMVADLRALVSELEAMRTGPAPVATEGMYDAAFFAFCFASDRSPRDGTYRWLTTAVNAALRKGREEGTI